MAKSKIGIIVSSTRPGRFADIPVQWLGEIVRKRDDADFELVDLRDYPMPFFEEKRPLIYAPPENEVAIRWGAKMLRLVDTPEKLLSQERWDAINGVPKGEITIERVQHAFYMAANYGFQILNGNFAAAIDDYELKLRFMNDLATYRIDVTWLWTLLQHKAKITKDGFLKRPKLTEDGVEPAENADAVKAGTPFTMDLYEKLWNYHNEWTAAFFAEQDKSGSAGRFDRDKANVIMELLKKQLPSPRYIQHSARVLFVMGQANKQERAQLLEAIFDLTREEAVKRVQAGTLSQSALTAHDYVFDIFSEAELKKNAPQGTAAD